MANVTVNYSPTIQVGSGTASASASASATATTTAAPAGTAGRGGAPSAYDLAPKYGYKEEDIARARRYNEQVRVRNTMERENITIMEAQEQSQRRQMNNYRLISNSLLAINMSLLGVNFSLMTFGMSLKRAGVLTDQQYETFLKIQGALGMIISATQFLLSIESLIVAIKQVQEIKEWSIAGARIAQYGLLAIGAAAAAAMGVAMVIAIRSGLMASIMSRFGLAANGAYVMANPAGHPFIVGEGGQNEVIAPEPMLRRLIAENSGGNNITVYAIDSKDVRDVLEELTMDNIRRGL